MQNVKSPTSKLSVKCCKIDRIHFLCVHLAVNIMQVIKLQTHRVVSYMQFVGQFIVSMKAKYKLFKKSVESYCR